MKTRIRTALAVAAVAACLVVTPSLTAAAAPPVEAPAAATIALAVNNTAVAEALGAAPSFDTVRVVPTACRYETRYHSDWFQCWAIFTPAPSYCWYSYAICTRF